MSIYEITHRPGTRIIGENTDAQILAAFREQLPSRRKLIPGVHDIKLPEYENSSFSYSVKVNRWGGKGIFYAKPKVPNAIVKEQFGNVGISFPIQSEDKPVSIPIDELHNVIPIMQYVNQSESILHKTLRYVPSTFLENLRDAVRLPTRRKVK